MESKALNMNYCCSTKQYYCQIKNLVHTLIIVPRVIVCKKLQKGQEYSETITIQNKGEYPRNLLYTTDSKQDTKLVFPHNWNFNHLQPDSIIEVKVLIKPTAHRIRGACRHIYIQSEHPNITFEIPIIVLKPTNQCYLPKTIEFPSSLPNENTYYEFIAFNRNSEHKALTIKSYPKHINITLSKNRVSPNDFVRILLTYKVRPNEILEDIIKIKMESMTDINIMHSPPAMSLYLNTNNLIFGELKYERESIKTISICNECEIDINLTIMLLQSAEQLYDEEEVVIYDTEWRNATSYVSISSGSTFHSRSEENFSLVAHKHFEIPKSVSINGHRSTQISVRFYPVMIPECDFDENSQSPHKVCTKLFIFVDNTLPSYKKCVNICGYIKGPEVEIYPKEIRLRKTFLGEENCENIKVLNVDGKVNAQVKYLDIIDPNSAGALVKPEDGYNLKACESGIFRVSFFAKIVGAFIVKLRFKVKNGDIIDTNIKGQSMQPCLKIYPDKLQYGVLPFGVPCKRVILLVNTFLVPVTAQVTIGDDGEEIPLVLNVENADGPQPITVKDYATAMLNMANEDDDGVNTIEERGIELINKSESLLSYRSISTINSSCSSEFDKEILDAIPDLAFTIVERIKDKHYVGNKEAADCIISEALEMLLNRGYFNSLKQFSNYAQMDWSVLPFNPKEVYCDKEVIYLHPNTGKSVTVILIPNRVGDYNRPLNVRICPINEDDVGFGCNTDNDWSVHGKFFINSKLMTSQVWMKYICRLPEIKFTQEIRFEYEDIYVHQDLNFSMLFQNTTNVAGFFYYDVIPSDDENGEMIFPDNITKFFLHPLGQITIESRVIFYRMGKVRLSGLIKVVGNLNGFPFHIFADVKKVDIKVSSRTIYKRQKVLESTVVHLYIDNATPTVTKFNMKLKNTKYQYIEPSGAILSPDGQGMYVSIFSKFYDADTYYNTLIINVAEGTNIIEIPITYVIEGSPILINPNIFNGHDCGTLMVNCQDKSEDSIPKYTKIVKLINKGKHKYCYYIDKLRNNLGTCSAEPRQGYVTVTPKVLCLEPDSVGILYITADSCVAATLYNEFRVRTIDQEQKLKVHTARFTVTANFVEPQIVWCQKQIQMEYEKTHVYKEHPVLAIARLRNMCDLQCNVLLKVLGPFKIKQLFEDKLTKSIAFPMNGLEEKEITIALHKTAIRDEYCSTVDGRIVCEANCKVQKSLPLKLIIRSPEIKLTQPEMILFNRGVANLTYVELRNISCLDAQYKWRKFEENTEYVSDHDDTYQFSHDLLSEILRTLDYDETDSHSDSIYQRNMTLRYQRYRCKLEPIQDTVGVVEIINEIIDHLDLEHKRYAKLAADDPTSLSSRHCTSREFVGKTLDDVLFGLKLEDSYDISQESVAECDVESKIHFVEKSGLVQKFSTTQTALYLPAIKPGYAKTAIFVLDTVGSCPQKFYITLVNLDRVLMISSDSVYLGIKPWYELFKATVRAINVTQYPITVDVMDKAMVNRNKHLYQGYTKILGDSTFNICPFKSKILHAEGIMGLSEQFVHEIQVTANRSKNHIITLRGQGVMPIILVTSKLTRIEQTIYEILDEYELLQSIYYFDAFKSITEYDADITRASAEEHETVSMRSDYSVSTLHTENSNTSTTTHSAQVRFYRMMRSYVMVNNNYELPNADLLEQLVETQKFLKQLKDIPKTTLLLRKVYQDYVKLFSNSGEALPINLKHFTTQPLPFQQQGFVLNMNSMVLGQLRRFKIDINFCGPGKLIASVRTEVKIPGLYVDFAVKEGEDHDYLFYAAEKKSSTLFGKRYRNMYERTIDAGIAAKIKHAHSFDLNKREQHTRLQVDARQRKELQNYYNSLNKSVYEDHKHNFTLCKIFSNRKSNYFSGEASIVLLFKPEREYYEEGQIIEDYLYIDLHLGPTLPILLRGLITKKQT